MAKRVNILYFGNLGGQKPYMICEHMLYDPLHDEDHKKFDNLEEVKKFFVEGFRKFKKRNLEIALDPKIPNEDEKDLVGFLKANFDKIKIISYS